MKGFLKFVLIVLITALMLGAMWYFVGETTITATFDGKPLNGAIVEVDGVFVGKTPYTKRLVFGHHSILVTPPKGLKTKVKEWRMEIWSVVLGRDQNVAF